MVGWECPTNPREASGLDPKAVHFTILEKRGAFEASLVAYLVPVVATVVGVFALGESIGLPTILGFGLVAAGFAMLKRRTIVDAAGTALGAGS